MHASASKCGPIVSLIIIICSCLKVNAGETDFRLNHVQTVGSHNSYHRNKYPNTLPVFDYGHPALVTQLQTQNVRQVEIDMYRPVNVSGELLIPVKHVAGFDNDVSCSSLSECLAPLSQWSSSTDSSFLVVMIEAKEEFTSVEWDTFDTICRRFWSQGQAVITPGSLFKSGQTLQDSVVVCPSPAGSPKGCGWPRLRDAVGHALFVFDQPYSTYLPGLRDRVAFPMFPYEQRHDTSAVVLKINDPSNVTVIQDVVRDGYLVRTRADADFPFHSWTDASILSGFFGMLANGSSTVSQARLAAFLVAVGQPVDNATLTALMGACGGSPQTLSQLNCTLRLAHDNGMRVLPTAASLPTQTQMELQRSRAMASGAHFISSDYAGSSSPEGSVHTFYVSLSSGQPFGCNPLTTTTTTTDGSSSLPQCTAAEINSAATGQQNSGSKGLHPSQIVLLVVLLLIAVVGVTVIFRKNKDKLREVCGQWHAQRHEELSEEAEDDETRR